MLIDYHNMTPEAAESLKNDHNPLNASMENPPQVSGQPPNTE